MELQLFHGKTGMRYNYDDRLAKNPQVFLIDTDGNTLSKPGEAVAAKQRIDEGLNPQPLDFDTLSATECRERVEALGFKYHNFKRGIAILKRAEKAA